MSSVSTPDQVNPDGPGRGPLRWIIAGAVVALLAVAAVTAGLWSGPDDKRTELTEAALRQALTVGGPPGWTSTEPQSLLPQDGRTGRNEQRDGTTVGISHDGDASTAFALTWTTTVTASTAGPACDTLADWAVRAVQAPDADEIRTSCRGARNGGLFASHGLPSPEGRHMFLASADGPALFATLTFAATDPDIATD